MGLVRKPIAITGAHRCWTGAMRTPENSVHRKPRGPRPVEKVGRKPLVTAIRTRKVP